MVERYVLDTEVLKFRDAICDLTVYQKISHPLSHAMGAMPLYTQKEFDRSIALLMTLEKQLGTPIGRDLHSI